MRAIREGEVDALVVNTVKADRIFTLQGAETAYRALVEHMNEGAVTLGQDGRIGYCNRRFAEMLHRPSEEVIGSSFCNHVAKSDYDRLRELVGDSAEGSSRAELTLQASDGTLVPAHVGLSVVVLDGQPSRCMVVNAIKFTQHGRIIVHASRAKTTDSEPSSSSDSLPQTSELLQFSVSDTGIGISAVDQQRIFAPFTQADASTSRHFGGSGLGLAISQSLQEMPSLPCGTNATGGEEYVQPAAATEIHHGFARLQAGERRGVPTRKGHVGFGRNRGQLFRCVTEGLGHLADAALIAG